MKHIIPTITLTALVAAASAQQAAAPAGLNYNQVGVSRTSTNNVISAQFNPAGSNFLIGFATASNEDNDSEADGQINLGYVFRGVTQGIDATVGVAQSNDESTVYSLTLRRALNEVYQGLEISVGFASTMRGQDEVSGEEFIFGGVSGDDNKGIRFVEVAYNVNKTFQVAVGLTAQDNPGEHTHTVFSLRAGF
jgi:hypothetical protein